MVLNKFRHIADKIISSQVKFLVRIGIKPNILSFLGMGFAILAGICFALPQYFIDSIWGWVPPSLFFISGYLDLIDGGVARESGSISKFGGFLDSTLDRFGDSAILIGLMLGNMYWNISWGGGLQINNVLGYIGLSISIVISYTRSRAENEGVKMEGIGLMERGERFFFLLIGYIIEAILRGLIPSYNGLFFSIIFCIYLILCIYTVIVRIIHSYKWLSNPREGKD
ncbi:MAG: CDP-alcohol phosphatidyltransferase family protein [Candidatus Lokiarchaeota archaeon]|nr:CDP-alcohol phosphatidyltransferase family protein [Candidatus Lokiarchaeota archaeon]